MTVIGITGDPGQGKTLLMATVACMEFQKGKRVFTTFHVTYPYKKKEDERIVDTYIKLKKQGKKMPEFVDFSKLAVWLQTEHPLPPNSAILMIDEGYKGLDSRESMSIANKILYKFILQARKLGLDVYVSAQLLSSIEKRIRRVIKIGIVCLSEQVHENPDDPRSDLVEQFRYQVTNIKNNAKYEFTIPHKSALKIYDYYNSWEVVKSPIAALDKKAAKEMLAKIEAGEAAGWDAEGGDIEDA